MKLKSVTKENKELGKVLPTKVFEEIVESVKTNKDLEAALNSYIEETNTEEAKDYKASDFNKRVELVNLSEPLVEIIRAWDESTVALIRELQNKYSSNLFNLKDKIYYSPLPFILVTLDKEGYLIGNADKFYELHKEELEKHIHYLNKFRLIEEYKPKKAKELTFDEFYNKYANSRLPKGLVMIWYKEYLTKGTFSEYSSRVTYGKVIAKKYKNTISGINSSLKQFTYKSMVKDYFGLDLDEDKNAPKLAKQLKKAGIEYTDEEIRHFGEVQKWWYDWYDREYDTINGEHIRASDLWVDMNDFEIPNFVNSWAFTGSCNSSDSTAGADTHLVLKYLGFEYLKGYSTYYKDGKLYLMPSMRTYFLRKDNEIAHAGTYADFNGTRAKACYEFTTVLLCIVFNKKVSDFHKIKGMKIDCQNFNSQVGGKIHFWANQAKNDYAKFGTAEIFADFNEDLMQEYCEKYPSIRYALDSLSSLERVAFKLEQQESVKYLIKNFRKNEKAELNEFLELLKK